MKIITRLISVQQVPSSTPTFVFIILLSCRHLSDLLWLWNVSHVWHLRLERCLVVVAEALSSLVVGILLILVSAMHKSFGFFLSVENHQLFGELLVGHTELFANLNESTEAVDVIRVFGVNLLVDLEGIIKQINPSVA